MLVTKGEHLIKDNGDETGTIFKVLLADDELFCVGEVVSEVDEAGEVHETTDYINVAFYPNDGSNGKLVDFGFEKM